MKIYFREQDHKYVNELGKPFISTTTLVGKYYEHFDTDAVAAACEKIGRSPAHPKYLKYKGKSAWQIKQQWETATKEGCDRGNYHHNRLEDGVNFSKYYTRKEIKHDEYGVQLFTIDDVLLNPEYGRVDIDKLMNDVFWEDYPKIKDLLVHLVKQDFNLYAELGLFDEANGISGLCDLIAIKDNEYYILDWKTNKVPILKEAGYFEKDNQGNMTKKFIPQEKYMFPPISHMADCNHTHYTLQLNIYDYMVSLRGLTSLGRILIHITHDEYDIQETDPRCEGKYKVDFHKIPDAQREVKDLIKSHRNSEFLNNPQYSLF